MGTKSIDSIQSEQIDYLEADVSELLGKTNLMIGDINVLVPKLNDSINNLKNLITGVRGSGGYADYPGNVGDGLLKRLTDFDDYYTEHISSKFPPMVDIKGIPRIGYVSALNVSCSIAAGNANISGTNNFVVNDTVVFSGNMQSVTGLVAGTTYYIADSNRNPSWNHILFRVSATPGGSVVYRGGSGTATISYRGATMKLTHRAGDEDQMFDDGWECQDGTCVTATVTSRLTGIDPLPSAYWGTPSNPHTLSNVRFMPSNYAGGVNDTFWNTWNWPICEITTVNGNVTSTNFAWDPNNSASHPNNSEGFGWSVNDTMHSGFGPNVPHPYNPTTSPYDPEHLRWFNATVTSVGSQCIQLPQPNTGTLRSPATEYAWNPYYVSRGHALFNQHLAFYGDDSPGMGGISEPAPPAAGANSETSTHNIMDDSDTNDEDAYGATVLSASTDLSYKDKSSVLFLEDKAKVTRGKKLVRKTLNTLRSK